MALKSEDIEGAVRTSGVVTATSDYSCVFWYKPRAATGAGTDRLLFQQTDSLGTPTRWIKILSVAPSPLDIFIQVENGSGPSSSSVKTITIDKPAAIGYVRSGNDHRFYVDGVLIATLTVDITATGLDEQSIATDTSATSLADSEIQGFKEWDTALTLAELILEWNLLAATKTANLWAETPLTSDLLDISGNGRDWVTSGTTSFVTSATQVPLTNTSGPTSVAISLGTEYIQVNNNGSGASVGLAYKYTGAAGELVFGIWGLGTTTYLPTFSTYTDDTWSTIYNQIANYPRRPIEIPLLTDQVTVFIRIPQNFGNPVGSLYLRTHSFTQQAAPAGSILINDAGNGPSVALLSDTTGDPLQLRNGFPPGELAAILHDQNRMIHQDINTLEYKIHDDQLNLIATITGTNIVAIQGNRGSEFYIADDVGTDVELKKYSADGVLLQTQTLAATTITHIGPDSANDILYYAQQVVNAPIKRWSISGNTFLSDLAPGIANFIPWEILWLNGNTILVVYLHDTTANLAFVRQYSAAGATIIDFNTQFGARTGADFHIAYDFPPANPEVNFWAWIKIANGLSRFMKIRLSDGVILTQFDRVHFTNGSADDDDENFGHSESCNLVITPEPIPTPPSANGTLIVIKITDPVTLGVDFVIAVQGGLTPAQITLQHGDSEVYTNVTPGTYAVIEEPQTDWVISYNVSNGSPNTAVTVAAGETVTVTVTNTRKGRIIVNKVTNTPSGALFGFTTVNLTPPTFSLADGEQFIFEDIDPGSGYQVAETSLPTGWTQSSVVVNNGSPINNLLVEAGLDTIVTFFDVFLASTLSGIYKIVPNSLKTNDTLWTSLVAPTTTVDVKIPDPTARTGGLGS